MGIIKDKDLSVLLFFKHIMVNISKLASCGLAFFHIFLKAKFLGTLFVHISHCEHVCQVILIISFVKSDSFCIIGLALMKLKVVTV